MVKRFGGCLTVPLNPVILLMTAMSAECTFRAMKQREIMSSTHPWRWAEVENLLHDIGGKWDGEKGTIDEETCPLSLGRDEMMRNVFLGFPS